jgi:hypothetical protein
MRRIAPANATTVVENFAVLGRRGDWAGRLSAVQQSERMDPMGKAKDIKHAAEGAPLRPARRPEGHHRGGRGGAACRRRDERARSPGGEAVGRRLSRRRNADYCRNFGDGRIHVYNPNSGRLLGTLRGTNDRAITIDGPWGLLVGDPGAGGPDSVWFSAGSDGEAHGLLGILRPS